MATSSIFANFDIKDKKTAIAFVKALEESASTPKTDTKIGHVLLTDSVAIKERFRNLTVSGKR